jgi:integrase
MRHPDVSPARPGGNQKVMDLIDRWAVALRDGSPATARSYLSAVRRCAAHAGVPPEQLTGEQVNAWLAGFGAPATRWQYAKAVRQWAGWLEGVGAPAPGMLAGVRGGRRPAGHPHPVGEADLRRLLASIPDDRTRAMVLLGAWQGLRAAEIGRVRGGDVDPWAGTLRVVGKGRVPALLPLDGRVAAHARRMPDGWWFPRAQDPSRHLDGSGVWRAVTRAGARAGVDVKPHDLRHRYATALLRAGSPLPDVQRLMRHSSLATTQVYLAVTVDDLRAAQDRLAA